MTKTSTEKRIQCTEIFKQLGGNKAMFMLNGKAIQTENGNLRILYKAKSPYNMINITLNHKDLYNITFTKSFLSYKTFELKITKEKSYNDVFVEDMVSLIESETGLFLKI